MSLGIVVMGFLIIVNLVFLGLVMYFVLTEPKHNHPAAHPYVVEGLEWQAQHTPQAKVEEAEAEAREEAAESENEEPTPTEKSE